MRRLLIALIGLSLAGCAPTEQALLAGQNAVQHRAEGRLVDVPPALAKLNFIAPISSRYDLVLPGRRAAFRVGGRQPIFYSVYPAPEIKLFRLEPGIEHDDRNLKVRAGPGVLVIPGDVEVAIDTSREGDSFFRITPRAPLPPGEYAFLSQIDIDRWQKYPSRVRVYSFGVD